VNPLYKTKELADMQLSMDRPHPHAEAIAAGKAPVPADPTLRFVWVDFVRDDESSGVVDLDKLPAALALGLRERLAAELFEFVTDGATMALLETALHHSLPVTAQASMSAITDD
jgi:hypothetical protein